MSRIFSTVWRLMRRVIWIVVAVFRSAALAFGAAVPNDVVRHFIVVPLLLTLLAHVTHIDALRDEVRYGPGTETDIQ